MNLLDIFEGREPHQQAIDRLEQARIDHLEEKMDYYAQHDMVKEFMKAKAERDSYYKVQDECMGYGTLVGEQGIGQDIANKTEKMVRATPSTPASKVASTVKNAAKWLAGKGGPGQEGPTYESVQKKNSKTVTEYLSMGSDKNYAEAEPYKNYKIYVRKKPYGNTGMYTAHTEIDRKEFMGKGSSQEEAVQAIRDRIDFVLNAQKKVTGSSTIDFNVKFATDLLADPKHAFYAKLENINGQPKLVIASPEGASDPELLASGDFKRSALRNQVDDQGRATPLPGIPLTAKSLRSGDWIANGRYTIGNETTDRDGNRVFDLTYHSTAHTKSDKLRLNQPAFTLGTAREVDEGFQDFNKVEPYEVCLAGKCVKTFDYYEDARRFHDNWKKKLYNQGEKEKADKITLNPVMKEQGIAESADQVKKVFKDKTGNPVGEIGIDPESSPGNGEWYVYHYGTGYSVVGFDSAAEAKRELLYVHKHPDSVEGHESTKEQGVAEAGSPAQQAAIAVNMKKHHKKPKGVGETTAFLTGGPRLSYGDQAQHATLGPVQVERHMPDGSVVVYCERDGKRYRTQPSSLRTSVAEESTTSSEAVERAVLNRIMVSHTDLLMKFGPEKVMQAVEEVAYGVGDVDEIGTSDVSAWVNEVKQILGTE